MPNVYIFINIYMHVEALRKCSRSQDFGSSLVRNSTSRNTMNLYNYFLNRLRDNLHIVLSFSFGSLGRQQVGCTFVAIPAIPPVKDTSVRVAELNKGFVKEEKLYRHEGNMKVMKCEPDPR